MLQTPSHNRQVISLMEKQCGMRCEYAGMYKFYQPSELPCISEDVAQVFCYTHKIFQKFGVQDHDHVLTS
jgi:hypothetical protein